MAKKHPSTNAKREALVRWAMHEIASLAAKGYWGRLDIKFDNGCPVHMKKEESIIPPKDIDIGQPSK